jgi:hypothetical protein
VPRKLEMQRLTDFFTVTSARQQQRVFVVHGTGGMGKTQLCAEFAKTSAERFSAVFWLDGSSKDALRRSMASAGSRVSTRTSAAPVKVDVVQLVNDFQQWLSLPGNTRWLMVIDNIDRDLQSRMKDDQAYDYHDFLPHANHGNVLITTRLRRLHRPNASLHLDVADDELAKEMVGRRADRVVTSTCGSGVTQLRLLMSQAHRYRSVAAQTRRSAACTRPSRSISRHDRDERCGLSRAL